MSHKRLLGENDIPGAHVYCMDHTYTYKSYNRDFGPLNLACMTYYIRDLKNIVRDNSLAGGRDPTSKKVIHLCNAMSMYQSNGVVLMGAYMIFEMGLTAEEAFKKFKGKKSKLAPF